MGSQGSHALCPQFTGEEPEAQNDTCADGRGGLEPGRKASGDPCAHDSAAVGWSLVLGCTPLFHCAWRAPASTQRWARSGKGLCGGWPAGCLGTGEACQVEGQRHTLKTARFLAPIRQPSCRMLRLGATALGLVLASATCSSDPRGPRVAVSITKHKEALCRALMICSLPLSRCACESQPTKDTQSCFLKVKEVI